MAEELGALAINRIVSTDPRRCVDGTLRLLMQHFHAEASCLFRLEDERLELFVGCAISQDDLDRTAAAWNGARQQILSGNSHTDGRTAFVLVPLAKGNGLLYLACRGRLRLEMAAVESVLPILRSALEAREDQAPSALDDYLESTPDADIERQRLHLLLSKHEWNIARVARVVGVHRLTIYKRMRRLGIPREKAQKARLRPGPSALKA